MRKRPKQPRLPGKYFDAEALRLAEVVGKHDFRSDFDDVALRISNTVADVSRRFGLDAATSAAVFHLSVHHYLLGLIAAVAGKPFNELRPEDVIAVAVHSHLPVPSRGETGP